jgi:hypothetical protein
VEEKADPVVEREKRREGFNPSSRPSKSGNHKIPKHLVRKSEHTKTLSFWPLLPPRLGATYGEFYRKRLTVGRGDGENPSVPSDPPLLSPDG